ncbi:MAG: hypothetical protein JO235_10805, partial [Chroococcidiopsidaceae cyanobacterium CP_BM_RX_35]|nr:hypothetical protein [Chroococcidiopsidaceae cyanobacterium CP_BM_RX_35]
SEKPWLGIGTPALTLSAIPLVLNQEVLRDDGNLGVWQSSTTLWPLTVDGLSLLAFQGVEFRSSHPILALSLFSNRRFVIVNFVAVLAFFTVVSRSVTFNLFLQQA